jgi:hypothetical protein
MPETPVRTIVDVEEERTVPINIFSELLACCIVTRLPEENIDVEKPDTELVRVDVDPTILIVEALYESYGSIASNGSDNKANLPLSLNMFMTGLLMIPIFALAIFASLTSDRLLEAFRSSACSAITKAVDAA